MRKLLWVSAGFVAACLLGAYLFSEIALLLLGVCLLPVSVVLLLLFREVSPRKAAALVLLGLALGMLWFALYSHWALAPAKSMDGKTLSITAEARDFSYATGYGTAVDAKIRLEDRAVSCKLYLEGEVAVSPGDRVAGEFYLCFTGAEGEKESSWYSGSGVFLLCYQRGEPSVEPGSGKEFRHFPARLRRTISQTVEALFPADTAAFAKALLLGDTTDVDYETDAALSTSGIVHVVAVSGLHVSILFSVLFLFLGRRRGISSVAGAVVLLLVAAVTGFSASIVRSCLMNGLMLLAMMTDREYDPLTALAFALLVMLGVNPLSVTSVALQLSAASVVGINLLAMPVTDWLRARNFWAEARRLGLLYRLREWFSTTVGVSIAATLATAPLTALHFGTVSLIGWLTNLLVLWLVNAVFVGILICAALGSLWAWAAGWIAWLLSWGIRFVLLVAKGLSRFPLAAVYTQSPYIVAWLIAAYGMLTLFLIMKRKRRFQLCFWTAITLAAAIALSWLEPRLADYYVTVVDVGQGQCVILHSEGKTYLVDCGGSFDEEVANRTVAALHSQGIFRVDGLIVTHYDRDHVGGVPLLLSRVPVNTLYLPRGPDGEEWFSQICGNIHWMEKNEEILWRGASIQIFTPGVLETSNESSLCVLFQKGNCDILITGDQTQLGEMALLCQYPIPELDVLVVGHHGSHSSTGEFLLERTKPAVAVISVGEDNGYGHPSPEVLELLERFGCEIRRTDIEGNIIIKG